MMLDIESNAFNFARSSNARRLLSPFRCNLYSRPGIKLDDRLRRLVSSIILRRSGLTSKMASAVSGDLTEDWSRTHPSHKESSSANIYIVSPSQMVRSIHDQFDQASFRFRNNSEICRQQFRLVRFGKPAILPHVRIDNMRRSSEIRSSCMRS